MDALLLIAHGTVERLDELPAFLANIRRGHAAPPDLVAEVRRRYEAIGGRSPLLDVSRSLAAKVGGVLGVRADVAMRLWAPYSKDVVRALAAAGVTNLAVVPLAQHSAAVYGASVEEVARPLGVKVRCARNWGRSDVLVGAFADRVRETLADIPPDERGATRLVITAHSLPVSVIRAGDAYADEVHASAALLIAKLGPDAPAHRVAYQSQGMSGPGIEWLGPDLRATLRELAAEGARHVIIAPTGFLADHVEILYDLDIEARAWATELGMRLHRTRSLNDADDMVRVVAAVARPLLSGTSAGAGP